MKKLLILLLLTSASITMGMDNNQPTLAQLEQRYQDLSTLRGTALQNTTDQAARQSFVTACETLLHDATSSNNQRIANNVAHLLGQTYNQLDGTHQLTPIALFPPNNTNEIEE